MADFIDAIEPRSGSHRIGSRRSADDPHDIGNIAAVAGRETPFTRFEFREHWSGLDAQLELARGAAGKDDPRALVTGGPTLNGSANPDIIAVTTSGTGTITAQAGDDLVIDDTGPISAVGSTSPSSIFSLDSAWWTLRENALIENSTTVPHATLVVTQGASPAVYLVIVVRPGETVTLDVDAGAGALGTAHDTDLVMRVYSDPNFSVLIGSNDDAAPTAGGYGSLLQPGFAVSYDPYLVLTNNTAVGSNYYIKLSKYQDASFSPTEQFMLNVSLTNHVVNLQPPYSAGNSTINGGDGNDMLLGGPGNDMLIAEVNDLVLDGGTGTDTVSFAASGTLAATLAGFEALALSGGAAIVMTEAQFEGGFAATSTLSGTGSLTINMGAGDSELYLQQLTGSLSGVITVNGSANDDVVKGAAGSVNTINGGSGFDLIRGGQQADTLSGGIGDDKIEGGQGADILTGGAGADQFRYQSASAAGLGAAADQITDFAIGTDKLGFQLIDADPVAAGDQAFGFIGTAAFTNTGVGQIRYQGSGPNLLVQVDVDGNGVADMEIVLQGLGGQVLTSGDFWL